MRLRLFLAAICIGLTTLSAPAQAGHVYLLKGFANIFSTGLDTLQEKLARRGFTATVHNYLEHDSLAKEAAYLEKQGKGPIIIVGHSLGANDAITMAEEMKALNAPVALVVLFGPTEDMKAPSNVARVINYYQSGVAVGKGKGFTGTISNINLDFGLGHQSFQHREERPVALQGDCANRGHRGQDGARRGARQFAVTACRQTVSRIRSVLRW